MKKLIFILIISLTNACCNKDETPTQPPTPISQLPPATQSGANTFACLLDGQVFKPGTTGGNPLDCVYQIDNGGYYFSLQANRRDANNNLIALGCSTQNLQLIAGQTYQLKERIDGNAYGKYYLNVEFTYTNIIKTGELKVTRMDEVNNIASGTFWYDITDYLGNEHQIREGRFDVTFTQ